MLYTDLPHGLMFHHFHDHTHPKSQGSIAAIELEQIIKFVGVGNILDADEWTERSISGELHAHHRCITFDDNLRCQYDIAFPVLQKYKINAFWFIYTSVFEGNHEKLELYRYFRHEYFDSIDDFYESFFETIKKGKYSISVSDALRSFDPDTYSPEYSFYTANDRKFRFVRDRVLGPRNYDAVMEKMLDDKDVDVPSVCKNLWMNPDHILSLHKAGHQIGLHSHTHPTKLGESPATEQKSEYFRNNDAIRAIIGENPVSVSFPCGSYNHDSLQILEDMGVKIGFRDNMTQLAERSNLETAREDHVNILKKIKNMRTL